MREIKFRAWHNKYGMSKEIRIGDYPYVNFADDIAEDISTVDADKEYKLMQYTGLKDKDGKEIYEGDIVRYRHKKNHFTEDSVNKDLNGKPYHYPGKVEMVNGAWAIICGEANLPFYFFMDYDREIIGNIYENSDLL